LTASMNSGASQMSAPVKEGGTCQLLNPGSIASGPAAWKIGR
jgi:hypothetical protein